ncbi:HD domain-containing protein [Halalkaliarchaeum sp. AArc-GB]|uniref:HD domain-containing protein n=1 Tax=Halalkaliarchaeum sp. AArc-GB TaxID=3074078 RepID=UPI00285F0F7B|nr:HD domain-containing protein [Halalkaliarchaeum sp. AArc-GB]MDR5674747.1 HD domain-containing protein [Halalkaliarchaeum sp. AArc-GB]
MNDLERAIDLAVDAYAGQTDKANETYIRHPLRVMEEMDTERERVVAVLHDVVEDANYTLEVIEQEFGLDIRDAVDALTKREDESYMAFVERAAANPTAREVKIADIEDNMDLTRLDSVNESVLEKQETYHEAWIKLQDMDQAEKTTN